MLKYPLQDWPIYDLLKAVSNRSSDNGDDALMCANMFTAALHFLIYKRNEFGKPLSMGKMLDWFDLDEHGNPYLKEDYP